MQAQPYLLTHDNRASVLESLKQVCTHKHWNLLAAHVRSTHVHAVVESEATPELVMNTLKAYASRNLNRSGETHQRRWARHGSTKWLWNDEQVSRAIQYVVEEQGSPMALFCEGAL